MDGKCHGSTWKEQPRPHHPPFSPTISPLGRHCWFSFLSLLGWLIYLVPRSDHVDFRYGIVTSRGTLEVLGYSHGHKSQVINERFYGFSRVKCRASWREDRGRVVEKGESHVSDGHRCSGSVLPTSWMVLHMRFWRLGLPEGWWRCFFWYVRNLDALWDGERSLLLVPLRDWTSNLEQLLWVHIPLKKKSYVVHTFKREQV